MQIKEAYSKISKGISIERFTLENVLPSKLARISRLSAHNKTRYGSLRTRNARGKKINNDTVCHVLKDTYISSLNILYVCHV